MSAGWAATALVLAVLAIALISAGRVGAGAPVILFAVLAAAVAVSGGGEPPPDS